MPVSGWLLDESNPQVDDFCSREGSKAWHKLAGLRAAGKCKLDRPSRHGVESRNRRAYMANMKGQRNDGKRKDGKKERAKKTWKQDRGGMESLT